MKLTAKEILLSAEINLTPCESPVDGDFSFHKLDDELVVSALGEGVEEDEGQGFGLIVEESFVIFNVHAFHIQMDRD